MKLLLAASEKLKYSSETPRLDAEILLAHILNLTRAQLFTCSDNLLTLEQQQLFEHLIERRYQGEPIAYLIGYREFWSHQFIVTSATLIPRPETELLIELVLDKFSTNENLNLLDLGTGSGAIALSIGLERKQWNIVATDISQDALSVARLNAKQLEANNVSFILTNWYQALNQQRFNIIISNPPYIASDDPHLQQKELQFEPTGALVAANHGMLDLHTIISQAPYYLLKEGWVLVEHGYNQATEVQKIFEANGFVQIKTYLDLAGQSRVTMAQYLF